MAEPVYRLEMHVSHFLSVAATIPEYGSGISHFKAVIDDRTRRMLGTRIPKKYFGALLPSARDLAFSVEPGKGNSAPWVLKVGSESMEAVVKYVDGHALFLFRVSEKTYNDFKHYLGPGKLASKYDIEFDFEPIERPRNYNCSGRRG